MMARTPHRESTRVCPGCNKEKTFPPENKTCSRECAHTLFARQMLPDLIGEIRDGIDECENRPLEAGLLIKCLLLMVTATAASNRDCPLGIAMRHRLKALVAEFHIELPVEGITATAP
jgi:hypothetical protein